MKLGIRRKLVFLLVAVALIPLVVALLVVVGGEIRLRRASYRRAYEAVALSAAQAFRSSLAAEVRLLRAALSSSAIVSALEGDGEPFSWDEVQRIDREWSGLPETHPDVASVLSGPGLAGLQRLQRASRRLVEVFFTDRHGRLITATNKTTDYYQADEEWWIGAFRGGWGSTMIPPLGYDASSGEWSLDICVPIFGEGAVVGVGKGVVKLNAWFEELEGLAAGIEGSVMLVARDGWIVYRKDVEPMSATAEEWTLEIADAKRPGWRIAPGGTMEAYVPITLDATDVDGPIRMTRLAVVVYGKEGEAFNALYRLASLAFAIGLLGIGAFFWGAVYVVDWGLVRRILRIASTAQRVTGGDLTARTRPRPADGAPAGSAGIWKEDEIEELGRDFDAMVERVETSYRQLDAANDLKQKFISIAGHELRTPISYIAGKARLLRDSTEPERLREGLRSIGAKAQRLHQITESMFKLMPDGVLPRTLAYEEIEPAAFLVELRSEVQSFLQHRGQTLVVEAAGLPPFRADREKLLDVLENLVTNAIKFTPDGGTIRLDARCAPDGRIAFSVTDQGEGIPSDELPHLFEPFFSGGEILQHSTGQSGFRKRGIGLGLSVVRYFTELHGGSVEARTGPAGSTFTVQIPRHPPEGLPPQSRAGPSEPPPA